MIYFDNAASTPLCNAAKDVVIQDFANPSSPHALGLESERLIKNAAKDIASILGVKSNELIFTSGGTESNNLGILGVALALKSAKGTSATIKIRYGKLEHPSVISPIKYLTGLPGFEIVDNENEYADIICQSQVSSETGDIFKVNKHPGSILFIDGAQAFCKMRPPTDADIYSFSGHKIHAPMGVGGLVIRSGIKIKPQTFGGGQQRELRAGTENVNGIVAMAEAAKYFIASDGDKRVRKINSVMQSLVEEIPNTYINQLTSETSPYILSLSFPGLRGETLTNLLSARGLYVSMGTACQSAKKDRILHSLIGKERAESAIRLSFSYQNTEDEAHMAKEIIKVAVAELRRSYK